MNDMVNAMDVADLHEEYFEIIQKFVEFLERIASKERQEAKLQTGSGVFTAANWPLGAKENLTRKDIYG